MDVNSQEVSQKRSCVACLKDESEIQIQNCDSKILETYKILLQNNVFELSTVKFCDNCASTLQLISDFIKKCLDSMNFLKNQTPFSSVYIKEEFLEDENESVEQKGKDFSENLSTIVMEKFGKKRLIKFQFKKAFVCDDCECRYTTRGDLNRHILIKHQNGTMCKYCRKIFLDKDEYIIHLRDEERKKRPEPLTLFCEHCGFTTTYKNSLASHIRKYHSPEEPEVICNDCGKSYKLKYELKQHIFLNHMEKRFQCLECDEKFAFAAYLRKHQKTCHSDEIPDDNLVHCEYCGKKVRASYLQTHFTTLHFKQNRYKCNRCDMTFTSSPLRYRHQMEHKKTKPFACNLCPSAFLFNNSLQKHFKNEHGVTYTAVEIRRICGLPDLGYLEKRKTKSVSTSKSVISCDDCGETFPKKTLLKQHQITTHMDEETIQKSFVACGVCGEMWRRSSMVHHMMNKHIDVRRYKCETCEKAFKTATRLKNHAKVHSK